MTTAVGSSTTSSQEILASLSKTEKSSKASAADDQQSRFLKLLTTQLKNQDPMNPMDNAQTTSQMAQISTVDGIERLNASITGMLSTFKGNEAFQAASLVGRQVLVDGNQIALQKGLALGGVELPESADHVYVSILNSAGVEVDKRDLGGMEKGSATFVWDGKLPDGSQAADGNYKLNVTANRGSQSVKVSALEMATVTSVVNDSSQISIDVGRFGLMSMNDVKRIL